MVGPNGCGKSTLLRGLGRLLRPRGGEVVLDGRDISRLPTKEVARTVGLLPQSPIVPEGVSVLELVERGRHPHLGLLRTWSRADEAAVAGALERTDLVHLAGIPVDSLSGGQRQRAWIAMVLAQQTPVMLLDEPTSFLDVAHQLDVHDLVRRLCDDEGVTVVMVLHDLAMAARYADHLVAMRDGRVVAEGPPAEVVTPRGHRGGLRRHRHRPGRPGLGRPRRHPPQEDLMTTTTATPLVRTDFPQFEATVVSVTDLGGGMRRVTCAAEGLRSFVPRAPTSTWAC